MRNTLASIEPQTNFQWKTFHTKSLLGGALLGQKKYVEAEPLLLAGYEGLKARESKSPADGMELFSQAMERLVQLYTEWEKPDLASAWQQQLDDKKIGKE